MSSLRSLFLVPRDREWGCRPLLLLLWEEDLTSVRTTITTGWCVCLLLKSFKKSTLIQTIKRLLSRSILCRKIERFLRRKEFFILFILFWCSWTLKAQFKLRFERVLSKRPESSTAWSSVNFACDINLSHIVSARLNFKQWDTFTELKNKEEISHCVCLEVRSCRRSFRFVQRTFFVSSAKKQFFPAIIKWALCFEHYFLPPQDWLNARRRNYSHPWSGTIKIAFGRFGNAGRLISEELIQAKLMRRLLLLFRCSWSMSNTMIEACLLQSLRLNDCVCSRSAATYILHYTVRHMTTQPADKTPRASMLLSPFSPSRCIATLITYLSQFFFANGGQREIKRWHHQTWFM